MLFEKQVEQNQSTVFIMAAPAVMEVRRKGGARENRVAYSVTISPPGRDETRAVRVGRSDGTIKSYLVENLDAIKVSKDRSNIRFSAYGNTYKIREVKLSDANWALGRSDKINKPKNVKELKTMLLNNHTVWSI
jgi:hypothetical protein